MKTLLLIFFTCITQIICTSNNVCINEYLNDAKTYIEQTKADEAIRCLVKAYDLDPTCDEINIQLAMMYYYTRQPQKSRIHYEQYTRNNQHDWASIYNLATVYNMLGMFEKSGPIFENLYQLTRNEKIKGTLFKHYLRSQKFDLAQRLNPTQYWWYSENIKNKHIVLNCDIAGNGFGDAIQFMQYAYHLKNAGAQVSVISHQELVPLLTLCPYIDSVITKHDPVPDSYKTYPICIASLMILLAQGSAHTPSPYLFADQKLIAHWKTITQKHAEYKIGICWESSLSRNAFTHQIVANQRSIPLSSLQPLATIPNTVFYSLQRTTAATTDFHFVTFDCDFDAVHGRFMDTAALMKNLDLIITVDTSIAHLAGALGVPVWLLLTCESDYRWLSDISHTPYYPTMRLFRQTTYGNWTPVVEQLKKNITRLVLAEK